MKVFLRGGFPASASNPLRRERLLPLLVGLSHCFLVLTVRTFFLVIGRNLLSHNLNPCLQLLLSRATYKKLRPSSVAPPLFKDGDRIPSQLSFPLPHFTPFTFHHLSIPFKLECPELDTVFQVQFDQGRIKWYSDFLLSGPIFPLRRPFPHTSTPPPRRDFSCLLSSGHVRNCSRGGSCARIAHGTGPCLGCVCEN